ncbi:NAD(P)/FAD-dependent oxidoreductase [Patescibacteria group bacterium]
MNSQPEKSETDYDVVIIGGAAAGLTAALYAARRGMKTLVLTKALGGQAALTPGVENYPGTKKIGGLELMMQFQEQASASGAEIRYETVTVLEKTEEIFKITASGGGVTAAAVILAFGLTPRNLDVPGEEELLGKGVTYCATCDGPLYKGKRVAVVGGTREALDAALFLAKLDAAVTLIHEKDDYPTAKDLFEQVKQNDAITLQLNSSVTRIEGAERVERIAIQQDGKEETAPVDGVFIENGRKIDSSWLGDLVEYGPGGAIKTNETKETATPGLFAAGDLTTQRDKQIVVSAGAGATAALSVYAYLQGKRGKPAVLIDWKHTNEA